MDRVDELALLAGVYNKSVKMMLESIYVDEKHRAIANDFFNGKLPKSSNDLALRGDELRNLVAEIIAKEYNLELNVDKINSNYGKLFGDSKKVALRAIYGGQIKNDAADIKQFIIDSVSDWLT